MTPPTQEPPTQEKPTIGQKPARKPRASGPSGTQAVDRALLVLSSFVNNPEQGISELAAVVDLSPSTVHRLVQAIVAAGYLEQNPVTERYRLGHAAVVLGQSAREALGLERALPIMERIGGETGESVNLGVRQGTDVLIVLRVESVQPLRLERPPGTRIDMHSSAIGKALLAYDEAIVDELALTRHTPTTITDAAELKAELAHVRRLGYSIDAEEGIEGVSCVAAPILDRDGMAMAALAVQAPSVRMKPERQTHLTRRLSEAATEISELLFPVATTES